MNQFYPTNQKRFVVYYHANCSDGATSAAIALFALTRAGVADEDVLTLPMQYTSDSRRATPKDEEAEYGLLLDKETAVFFLDICPSPEEILRVADLAAAVVVLDHHATAYDLTLTLPNPLPPGVQLTIDTSNQRSGALLTWEFFMGDVNQGWEAAEDAAVRKFAELISAYDTWQKPINLEARCASGYVKRLIADRPRDYVRALEEMLGNPQVLFGVELVAEKALYQASVRAAEATARKAAEVIFAGTPVFLVNCPSDMASLTGEAIYEKHPGHVALMYSVGYDTKSGSLVVFVSLRSKVGGPSARALAERFSGGGHEHASGFRMSMSVFESLISPSQNETTRNNEDSFQFFMKSSLQ